MFVGAGLSGLMHFEIAMSILVLYLMLTINVSVNAHLKKEFCLTYAKMGPTEFRIIMILVNTVLMYVRPVMRFSTEISLAGEAVTLTALDIVAAVIFVVLLVIYLVTIIRDARDYDRMDPMPRDDRQ